MENNNFEVMEANNAGYVVDLPGNQDNGGSTALKVIIGVGVGIFTGAATVFGLCKHHEKKTVRGLVNEELKNLGFDEATIKAIREQAANKAKEENE